MTKSSDHMHEPARFRAVLRPHRSLSRTGFLVLMGLVTAVNIVTGVLFLLLGAWPVFGFCGLDVLIVYWAFCTNYRDARISETIELDFSRLSLVRCHRDGRSETFEMNPYWARVQLTERTEPSPAPLAFDSRLSYQSPDEPQAHRRSSLTVEGGPVRFCTCRSRSEGKPTCAVISRRPRSTGAEMSLISAQYPE